MKAWIVPVITLMCALLASCHPKCAEGTAQTCSCPSGRVGSQQCTSAGRFRPCVCVDPVQEMINILRREKTQEAHAWLAYIAQSMAVTIQAQSITENGTAGRFLESTQRTPSSPPTEAPYESTAQTWQHPTWQSLDFRIVGGHSYSYEVISSAAGYTARAYGDLNGDGMQSTFEIQGSLRRPYEVISGPVTFTSELE